MSESMRLGLGWMHRVIVGTAIVGGLAIVSGSGGCVAAAGGDDGASEDTSSGDDAIAGSDAVSRAMEWVNVKLHYCQSPNGDRDYDASCSEYCHRYSNPAWNPYRSDCSGLVSWAWGLPAPGRVTWEFAPYDNSVTHEINAIDLEPGDAVNNQDHVMLFRKWVTKGKVAEFIEEPGCSVSEPYARTWSSSVSISGSSIYVDFNGMSFHAIRYNKITQGGGGGNPPPPSNGTGKGSLGGSVTSFPATGHNADGRLEVFGINGKGELETSFQEKPNGGWTGWFNLGGKLEGNPSVVNDEDGRMEVFARGDDKAVWHAWQDAPNGKFSSFASLDGIIEGDPAVGKNNDGRLEVFAEGTDKNIWHRWQTKANGGWNDTWEKLGDATSIGGLNSPSVVKAHDGKLWVFARGEGGAIFHAEQNDSGWSEWASFGGDGNGTPHAIRNQDGRIELFEIGKDSAVRHRWEKTPGGAWSDWSSLGGSSTNLMVANDADGSIVALARGSKGNLYRIQQNTPNGGWSAWKSMDATIEGRPSADRNKDGRLETFYRTSKNEIDHQWEDNDNAW